MPSNIPGILWMSIRKSPAARVNACKLGMIFYHFNYGDIGNRLVSETFTFIAKSLKLFILKIHMRLPCASISIVSAVSLV